MWHGQTIISYDYVYNPSRTCFETICVKHVWYACNPSQSTINLDNFFVPPILRLKLKLSVRKLLPRPGNEFMRLKEEEDFSLRKTIVPKLTDPSE